jgi:hypothetical protein
LAKILTAKIKKVFFSSKFDTELKNVVPVSSCRQDLAAPPKNNLKKQLISTFKII